MTKQELIKKTGNEEQAAYAMEILLKNIKPAFLDMAVKAEIKGLTEQLENLVKEGLVWKDGNTYRVRWAAEYEPFGDEPGARWHATPEQEAESEAIRDRLNKANALIYTRNRTISLLAVRA